MLKILIRFRKLLIMHNCVTSIQPKVKFLSLSLYTGFSGGMPAEITFLDVMLANVS